jgi:hypothetical protein
MAKPDLTPTKSTRKTWFERRFKAGLCKECGRPRLPDQKLCGACAQKNRNRSRRKARGLRKRLTQAQKEECRRLRRVDRLSVIEISKLCGIAKSTVHLLVRDIPLKEEELRARRAATDVRRRGLIADSNLGTESPFFKTIMERVKNTDQKGAVAEAAAIFRIKVWGFVPHFPLSPGGKSDIIVFIPDTGKTVRLQVKCVRRYKNSLPYGNLGSRRNGKMGVRYAESDFDFYVGYDYREDVCYVYAMGELGNNKKSRSMLPDAAERWDKLLLSS